MCVAVIDTAGEVRGLAVDPSLSDELVNEGVGAKAGEAGVSTPATKKRRVEEPMPRGLLSVVPRQLADRVLAGQFVSASEFMRDNLMRVARTCSESNKEDKAKGLREPGSVISWVLGWLRFADVVAAKHPEKAAGMIRYVQVVAEGALKHGIPCAEKFDQVFRSGCQSLPDLDFGSVDVTLYLQEFLGRGRCQECQWCAGGDHKDWECAARRGSGATAQTRRSGRGGRSDGGCARGNACFAWNDGSCSRTQCRFAHVCSTCGGDHERMACAQKATAGAAATTNP